MKTSRLLSVALVGMMAACATPSDPAKAVVRTEVVFDHPESFSDVRDSELPTDKGRDAILGTLRDFIVERADSILPDGYKLKLVFTDIHLAGDYEPWHGPQWNDVRVIKGIYPPSFKFSYTVTDPSGAVVKQDSVSIKDMTFQTRQLGPNNDRLFYEKGFLDDWLRSNLRDLKKT